MQAEGGHEQSSGPHQPLTSSLCTPHASPHRRHADCARDDTNAASSSRTWSGRRLLPRDLGPRWAAVLGRHNEIVRAACRRHGGEVSASSGDGFSFVFAGADDATAAAWEITSNVEAEPWPEDAPLRVRVGVHFGAVEQFAGEFVGVTIHEAARVMALAGTSNVVLTEVARDAIGSLPNGTTLVDLGPHVLPRFSDAGTTVLPCRSQALVVRPLSIETHTMRRCARSWAATMSWLEIRDELATERMVSIVGPAGIGKTTVAIEVMRRHPGDAVVANLAEVESDDEVGTDRGGSVPCRQADVGRSGRDRRVEVRSGRAGQLWSTFSTESARYVGCFSKRVRECSCWRRAASRLGSPVNAPC